MTQFNDFPPRTDKTKPAKTGWVKFGLKGAILGSAILISGTWGLSVAYSDSDRHRDGHMHRVLGHMLDLNDTQQSSLEKLIQSVRPSDNGMSVLHSNLIRKLRELVVKDTLTSEDFKNLTGSVRDEADTFLLSVFPQVLELHNSLSSEQKERLSGLIGSMEGRGRKGSKRKWGYKGKEHNKDHSYSRRKMHKKSDDDDDKNVDANDDDDDDKNVDANVDGDKNVDANVDDDKNVDGSSEKSSQDE